MVGCSAHTNGAIRTWKRRVASWEQHVRTDPVFEHIRAAVVAAAVVGRAESVVDLGAGTGHLSLPLAARAGHVTTVDISPATLGGLARTVEAQGLANSTTVVVDLARYDLPDRSVDVVVSNYAVHHLTDGDKALFRQRDHRWLRPGGRLVAADMMFGRGGSSRDRAILRAKVVALAKKGPGGWWRIVKNVARLGLRLGHERPASPTFWTMRAQHSGFTVVTCRALVAEAGLLVARVASAAKADQDTCPPALRST